MTASNSARSWSMRSWSRFVVKGMKWTGRVVRVCHQRSIATLIETKGRLLDDVLPPRAFFREIFTRDLCNLFGLRNLSIS
jgi:hypothetical protein